MKVQLVPKVSHEVQTDMDAYFLMDHMPLVDLTGCHNKTFDQLAAELFGKNAYADLLREGGVDLKEKFFIFESYINLDQFAGQDNTIFFPEFFYSAARVNKRNITSDTIDFGKKTTQFNCPMHNFRYNRLLASCWLYNNQSDLDFEYTQSWNPTDYEAVLFELMKLGNLATWEGSQYAIKNLEKKYIPSTLDAPILYSQDRQFKNMFTSTAVSVITSATFWEFGCTLDEKYLNAIYAGTIPLCDAYGFIDTVKRIGFDVFDDIVDTSYQYEPNSVLRTWNMFEKNRHLLTNGLEYVNRPDIQERMLKNYEFVRDTDSWLKTAFKNLNTPIAQQRYLESYQECGYVLGPTWPILDL